MGWPSRPERERLERFPADIALQDLRDSFTLKARDRELVFSQHGPARLGVAVALSAQRFMGSCPRSWPRSPSTRCSGCAISSRPSQRSCSPTAPARRPARRISRRSERTSGSAVRAPRTWIGWRGGLSAGRSSTINQAPCSRSRRSIYCADDRAPVSRSACADDRHRPGGSPSRDLRHARLAPR